MNDLLCFGFWLVIVLAAVVIYRRSFSNGYWQHEHDPVYFDKSNPRDRHERKCVEHQRTTGRERGGELRWLDDD